MKRLLAICLAAVLLAGCGGKKDPQPTEPLLNPENAVLYIPSAVEKQTDGAVATYSLLGDIYFGIADMGSHILLMGNKRLTVVTGQAGEVTATLAVDISADTTIDVAATGVAYYNPETRQVTVLNPYLQVVVKMELPQEIKDRPFISITKNEVFYSTGNELRAMNMTTGISRLLRQQTASTQTLLGAYFDGTVLLCKITDTDGDVSTEYISAETGQTVTQSNVESVLQTRGDQYIACWQEGLLRQTAFGTRGQTPQSLQILQPTDEEKGGRAILPDMYGVVDYAVTESGLSLTYYDLTTGTATAKIAFSGVEAPTNFCGHGNDVYLLATDTETSAQTLYRWDVSKSATEDTTVCVGTLYTADNPDVEGLAASRAVADAYQTQYGIKLLLWQDAVQVTGGYKLIPEHHPQVIDEMLEQMRPILAYFPDRFLLKTVEAGWIQVALVRQIEGGADWVQFWEQGDCWIVISAEADVASCLLQGIAYGVDSHVLGNSREFDTWNGLNPSGFTYTYDANKTGDAKYLAEGSRAFADLQSMTYPHEDRCRIFYYATLPDKAEMFQSPVMQAKLLRLCKGIREAYNLQKKSETYIWEQYLTTSLAYVSQ